jgi:hypothetical protein
MYIIVYFCIDNRFLYTSKYIVGIDFGGLYIHVYTSELKNTWGKIRYDIQIYLCIYNWILGIKKNEHI